MRRLGTAAVAGAAALVGAQAQAATTYHYVYVSGPSAPYAPAGDRSALALEAVDAPPAAAEGEMSRGDVIARHTVRAAEAVVLDAPVKGDRRALPAGTVLVRVEHGRSPAVWCDLRPVGRLFFADQYDCLEDGGNGTFTRLWSGHSLVRFLAFGPSGVAKGADLPAPVAYHAAGPDTPRPTAVIGFRWCDGDGVSGPPRFALVVSPLDKTEGWPQAGACMFGVWPDLADKSKVEVSGLHLEIKPGADGKLHYRVTDRLPAGPIALLRRDRPVRPALAVRTAANVPPPIIVPGPPPAPAAGPVAAAGATPPPAPAPLPVVAADSAIVLAGPPPEALTGVVKPGQTLVRARVRHGMTGTLQNRIKPGMMWKPDTAVEVGQPMFGIPSRDGSVVWCAPRQQADKTWDTACFLPAGGGAYWWIPHRKPALLPFESLYSLSQTGPASSSPSVARGPVSLPEMELSYVLVGVKPAAKTDAAPTYEVDLMADWGEGPQKVRTLRYGMKPDGAKYRFFNMVLKLTPGPGEGEMQVERVEKP